MEGKTVLLTGATDGIGKQAAVQLAALGWRVVIHGRSTASADEAAHEVSRAVPDAALETAAADLASMSEVRALAALMSARRDHLDALVHNAGVIMEVDHPERTSDGFEMTMAINYFAPFLLTYHLMDLLRMARNARVVTVSSTTHKRGHVNLFGGAQSWNPNQAYADSKLAAVMFALELAERLAGTDVTSNALHPGVVSTKLLHSGFHSGGISPEEGARPVVFLTADPALDGVTGRYFDRMNDASPAPAALDSELRRRLWSTTERMLGIAPDVRDLAPAPPIVEP